AMVDDRPIRRAKMREKFAELKRAAIADLERRGYDVRGKTPAQIRLILKRRPSKQTSDAKKWPTRNAAQRTRGERRHYLKSGTIDRSPAWSEWRWTFVLPPQRLHSYL